MEFNRYLISKAGQNVQGSKLFGTGRVVILRDGVRYSPMAKPTYLTPHQHFQWKLAVILKHGRTVENVRSHFILAMVDPETKARTHGQ